MPGILNTTFLPPQSLDGKASEIAFKPSCDTDSLPRSNDIILGIAALEHKVSWHSNPVVGKFQDT